MVIIHNKTSVGLTSVATLLNPLRPSTVLASFASFRTGTALARVGVDVAVVAWMVHGKELCVRAAVLGRLVIMVIFEVTR